MIYGIGSMYNSKHEKLPEFIKNKIACIGYSQEQAPPLHQLLSSISVGDIIYVKSFPPAHGLYIKAVGVVVSPDIFQIPDLGYGKEVHWVWYAESRGDYIHMGRLNDKYDNFRGTTLFQEYGSGVQKKVLEILLKPKNGF